ncbi:hypothetical protein BsWGS_05987 [Bradybaena similaris]
MAVYTTTNSGDIVLSDVHVNDVCLSHSVNTNHDPDSQTNLTWLSRFYFELPHNCKAASRLETFTTGDLGCRFGHCFESTVKSHTKRACGSLEKSPPQLDDDGDCVLVRRKSLKQFQAGSNTSFQHQVVFNISQNNYHISPSLVPVCENTHSFLEKDLELNTGKTIIRKRINNLLCVSENNNHTNVSHRAAYNTEDLTVHHSVHGTLEKSPLGSDDDGDVVLKRRWTDAAFQNAFEVDNDNKDVLKLPKENDSSLHVLLTDRKFDNSISSYDPLFDCSAVSVQEIRNKSFKTITRIRDRDTSQGTNTEHHENFSEKPDTVEQKLALSSFQEFDTYRVDNKCCSCEVKLEMAANSLSPRRETLAQEHSLPVKENKLKCVQNDSLTDVQLHSSGAFSVGEIKTLDKIQKVQPQSEEKDSCGVLTIEHSMGTSIPEVGYQVWSGALLLCDYLLHNSTNLAEAIVLDLGTGTGITAIVAAMFAPQVLSTDYLPGVVGLAERNWERNKDLLPLRACDQMCFKILDWTKCWASLDSVPESKYALTHADLKLVEEATVILAAEAIYDDELTDGLFTTIYNLLMKPPSKTVVLTVERRVIFSVDNKDVCSPAYEHFLENLQDLVTVDEGPVRFTAKKYDTSLPQCFCYQRVKELELWEISSQIS